MEALFKRLDNQKALAGLLILSYKMSIFYGQDYKLIYDKPGGDYYHYIS